MINFKFTRKQNNKLIPKRKLNIFSSVEAYYSESGVTLHYYAGFLGKLVATATLPIVILSEGLSNFREVMKEFYGVWFQKKTKNYISDWVPANTELYQKLEEIYVSSQCK